MAIPITVKLILATIVCAPVLALLALAASLWRRHLQFADLGTTFLPTLIFLMIANQRPEIQIGFAIPVWSIVVAVLSMYAIAIKIFAFDLRTRVAARNPYARIISVSLFLLSSLGAAVLAIMIEPWYK